MYVLFQGISRRLEESKRMRGTEVQSTTQSNKGYIKRNIYNTRRKKYPPLAKSIEDVHSVINSFKAITNEKFVLVMSGKHNHFACEKNLRFLTNCDII